METEKQPKVSVCVVTYNQENYIQQCLQSIVDQKVSFDFEVIVSDDCSTDDTRSIIKNFKKTYPDLVKVIFQTENIGGLKNYLAVHRSAKGEYVSHVDGDDWLCPGKLEKQVLYLDANETCALVAHRMQIWRSEEKTGTTKENAQSITLSNLLRGHPMFMNSSIMYRRSLLGEIFHLNKSFIDFYVYVAAALRADIGFINEVLGNYRSSIGISSRLNLMPYIEDAIDLASSKVGETRDVARCRARQHLSYATTALCSNDLNLFRTHLSSSIRADRFWMTSRFISFGRFFPKSLKYFLLAYKKRA
ncbi:glycosyltransferase family 2 protein [Rhodoferax sediminis]|nr:glycosyltransferase [Rhodoferax sediminis]